MQQSRSSCACSYTHESTHLGGVTLLLPVSFHNAVLKTTHGSQQQALPAPLTGSQWDTNRVTDLQPRPIPSANVLQPQHQLLAPHELNTLREQAKLSHLVSCKPLPETGSHNTQQLPSRTAPHELLKARLLGQAGRDQHRKIGRYSKKNLENRLVHSTWDPLQSPSLGKQLVLSSHLLCCHGLCVQFHQAAFVFFLKALLNISQWEGNLRAVT